MSEEKRNDIVFLCVANSARSQLAEGWARALAPLEIGVHSAGSSPGRLHPLAVEVMAEVGIDLRAHYSKSIDDIPQSRIATAITLCAEEVCPIFPGEVERLHWPTDDPARGGAQSDDEIDAFRRARDEIGARVREFMTKRSTDATAPNLDDLDIEALRRQISEKWNTYEPDVLPAWVAQMDFPLAKPIRRVIENAAISDDVGYPIAPRDTPVLDLFAARMQQRFGWRIEAKRCEIISDVVQGMYLGVMLFRGERDGVVVQTPIYPPFLSAVRETGARLVENRLLPGQSRWSVDLDALRASIDADTGMLLLCNPHNPTGRVFERAELEGIAALAVEHDLIVLSDEIHSDMTYDGAQHIPIASLNEEIAARTVTLTSASKAFDIPGLRCAVAHFGSADLQRRLNRGAPRRARGGIGLLGLYATEAAWRHCDPWLDAVCSYLQANRNFLKDELERRFPRAEFQLPEASYLAWVDFSAYELAPSPARFFHDRGRVALSEGGLFGAGYEHFVRINFATSRAILTQVLDRMQRAFDAPDGA